MLDISLQDHASWETKDFDKLARFLQSQSGSLLRILQEPVREVRRMKSEYDVHSAITFLLVGLGIGSVLATVLKPKQRVPRGDEGKGNCSRSHGESPCGTAS
jgi:hypothetical protein